MDLLHALNPGETWSECSGPVAQILMLQRVEGPTRGQWQGFGRLCALHQVEVYFEVLGAEQGWQLGFGAENARKPRSLWAL
jgi:hypothetical protein